MPTISLKQGSGHSDVRMHTDNFQGNRRRILTKLTELLKIVGFFPLHKCTDFTSEWPLILFREIVGLFQRNLQRCFSLSTNWHGVLNKCTTSVHLFFGAPNKCTASVHLFFFHFFGRRWPWESWKAPRQPVTSQAWGPE